MHLSRFSKWAASEISIDPRLDDPQQFPDIAQRFPIAVALRKGHIKVDPDEDRVTKKLPGLHMYQLALLGPTPKPGKHFNADGVRSAGTSCSTARQNAGPVTWSRSGQSRDGMPTNPGDIGIDSFQSDRSPGRAYKTMNLAGLFIRELGVDHEAGEQGPLLS